MAAPRIFVSSTCYDLQEIRFQLRGFIQEYGYEAVLSEFDDIFFDYDKHVQDACLDEIPKCQLFILIIGNNYGSFYHKENSHSKMPDSVTLKEFRRALDHKISKHLFINKYVDYDYKNHKKALNNYILKYFQDNQVVDENVEQITSQLKEKFNKAYHFPSDSYKYIFPFLDIVYELNEGNAISTFESFSDIKDSLKKQWAGLIYEALTNKRHVPTNQMITLESKIDNIEKNINKLINSKTSDANGYLTFNVEDLIKDVNIGELTKLQDKIQSILWNLCNVMVEGYNERWNEKRFYFKMPISIESTKTWLNDLNTIIQNYKWSKYIHIETLFNNIEYKEDHSEINYQDILELNNIYRSLEDGEKDNFVHSVLQVLKDNAKAKTPIGPPPISITNNEDDDLPF